MSGPDMLLEIDYIRKQDLQSLNRSEGTGSEMWQSNPRLDRASERSLPVSFLPLQTSVCDSSLWKPDSLVLFSYLAIFSNTGVFSFS